ncbi:chromatin remodelling complex Rsc7/Swp82 subunit-domain-containing protein [Hysterangium stoloniferum]|nr:chromatin remodelling complex Rsc7/Swp82 subunit-domain-containing protein [Hysterangium stoloniferum]
MRASARLKARILQSWSRFYYSLDIFFWFVAVKSFRKIGEVVYILENDELVTDEDPKGDEKIDKDGVLQGGRQFKAQTFTLPTRHPTRQYMLAIEAARTSGYKDSLYYFRRNPLMHKLVCTQPEKDDLIAGGTIPSHMRTRSVTLVTARSAYKQHGAKMLRDGKWVTDDYYEDKSLAETLSKGLKPGDPVGEFSDLLSYASTKDPVTAQSQPSRPDGPSRGGGALMYKPGGPTTYFGGNGLGPFDGDLSMIKKMAIQRDGVDRENWMWTGATKVQQWNEEWTKARRERLRLCGGVLGLGAGVSIGEASTDGAGVDAAAANTTNGKGPVKKRRRTEHPLPLGVYEPHSGIVHYRVDTQPTQGHWQPVLTAAGRPREVLGGTRVGAGAWGLAWVDTVMEYVPDDEERTYREAMKLVEESENQMEQD